MPKMHASQWSNEGIDRRDRIRKTNHSFDSQRAARRPRRKPDGRETFKCGHCRAFIGPTVSGGRHRNHCPLCLYSRHVDRSYPGDRLSDCRSLMEPIGIFFRDHGEQMIVHHCLGCAAERHNRIAADDNPVTAMRLPPIAPRRGKYVRPEESIEEAVS